MTLISKIARRLVFYTYPHDLTRDTTLLLSFMPPKTEELYRDIFPIAWKVLRISGGHVGTSAVANYSSRLAFGVTQINNTNLTIPETFIELGLGQSTRLTTNNEGFTHWSLPSGKPVIADGPLKAVNDTGDQKDISIGSLDVYTSSFLPIICWPKVNNGGTATVKFTPDLHVYAYSGYRETELIRGEVENFLGNWNLATLLNAPNDNRFHVFEDKNEGQRLKLVKD
ncbi:hypothetical protein FRC11_006381 [Ceratobasidium sp. 423]|nr:hypothetical protein FRC11_006381 [Ceratobasidium sp. 423]